MSLVQVQSTVSEEPLPRLCSTASANKGAYGVITTHYQNLKHFADSHEGVANGAMLYDRHEMKALFQLAIGRPGSSFAIEIARKIGLPEEVIKGGQRHRRLRIHTERQVSAGHRSR